MKKKNAVILWVLCTLMALLCCACGARMSAKDESEIVRDIYAQDSFMSDYKLNVISSHITKRQTCAEDKVDYVWIDVTASNYDFTYQASYKLTYSLYNDGWLLDDVLCVDNTYTANHPEEVTQEITDTLMDQENYDFWDCLGREEYKNVVVLTYEAHKYAYYVKTTTRVTYTFTFTPEYRWSSYEVSSNKDETVTDIVGVWRYKDGDIDLCVNVLDFEPSSGRIALEYSLVNIVRRDYLRGGPGTFTFYSNGVFSQTVDGQLTQSRAGERGKRWCYLNLQDGTEVSVVVGCPFSGGNSSITPAGVDRDDCGIWVSGYWLTKEN